MSRGAAILGLGAYRPANVVDNHAIAPGIDSSDEWIRERTGIVTRHWAAADETVADMSVAAGEKALADAGIAADDVGLVLLATCTLPEPIPAGSAEIAYRLGAAHAGVSDIVNACAGWSYALAFAASVVRDGQTDNVLVIGTEKLSAFLDPHDRSTAFIFGDGSGAAVVGASDTDGIGPVVWEHTGERTDAIIVESTAIDARYVRMDGRGVYRWATTTVPGLARRACQRAGVGLDELAAFVPHQANQRITESVVRSLHLGPDVVVADDVTTSGNTSAASIPLALSRLVEQGRVSSGDRALLVGFGAGLMAAAQVVRVP